MTAFIIHYFIYQIHSLILCLYIILCEYICANTQNDLFCLLTNIQSFHELQKKKRNILDMPTRLHNCAIFFFFFDFRLIHSVYQKKKKLKSSMVLMQNIVNKHYFIFFFLFIIIRIIEVCQCVENKCQTIIIPDAQSAYKTEIALMTLNIQVFFIHFVRYLIHLLVFLYYC